MNMWIFILVLFNLVLFDKVNQTKKHHQSLINHNSINMQRAIIEFTRNKNMTIIVPGAHLSYEWLCGPFDYYKYYKGLSIKGTGAATNIPYNKGYWDSYLSLLEENIFLFISSQEIPLLYVVHDSLIDNYGCETELKAVIKSDNYMLIKFVKKQD